MNNVKYKLESIACLIAIPVIAIGGVYLWCALIELLR